MGPWEASRDGSGVQAREMNYLLALNYAIGPKQTIVFEKQVRAAFSMHLFGLSLSWYRGIRAERGDTLPSWAMLCNRRDRGYPEV